MSVAATVSQQSYTIRDLEYGNGWEPADTNYSVRLKALSKTDFAPEELLQEFQRFDDLVPLPFLVREIYDHPNRLLVSSWSGLLNNGKEQSHRFATKIEKAWFIERYALGMLDDLKDHENLKQPFYNPVAAFQSYLDAPRPVSALQDIFGISASGLHALVMHGEQHDISSPPELTEDGQTLYRIGPLIEMARHRRKNGHQIFDTKYLHSLLSRG